MLELIKAGGWLMAPILLCSAIAVGLIVERFMTLSRKKVVPADLGEQVIGWATRSRLDKEHIDGLAQHSPLGRILAAAVRNRTRSREIIKEAVEDTGRHVVHELERYLNTLGTIAGISPLLGLLGTVVGMIKVFAQITTQGVGDAQALSAGISQALVTTAAGLVVAIPAFFFYRYFRGKVGRLVVDMEQEALALIDVLDGQAGTPARKSAPRRAPTGAA